MGDVRQSGVSAVDAHEFRGDRPRARNAIPEHREIEVLRLFDVRLKARRRVAGLARVSGEGNGAN